MNFLQLSARVRQRNDRPIKRLLPLTSGTKQKLEETADRLTKEVGFVVYPMTVAAILVEEAMKHER